MAQSALINVILRASERAARGLLRDFGEVENLQVSRKGVADFVSNADILFVRRFSSENMTATVASRLGLMPRI